MPGALWRQEKVPAQVRRPGTRRVGPGLEGEEGLTRQEKKAFQAQVAS